MNAAARKAVTVFRSAVMQSRPSSVVAYVATKGESLSTSEKLAHAAVIFGTIFAYPTWFFLHMKEYRESQKKK
ncbi:hypothetical protein HPB48_009168 [Haemaphysalis longicornis]|uniref:Cytochrome c oxidase polypeptide viii n=1 Tax=Haemaphysalis longicornis TaxID=44386 RepID=A0A9J6GMA5_HAELO|nr:hypothetical protein HPB48_009168 [Haemaphysalis longicornis]